MGTTKYATELLRKCARAAARQAPVRWLLGHTPTSAYATAELAAITATTVAVAWALAAAWTTAAGLGAPWWTGVLAAAFPAGCAARLAKEAPGAWTRYRNWRDHTIDALQVTPASGEAPR